MYVFQVFNVQLDQLPGYSYLPEVNDATKAFATLTLKGFGVLLTGYMAFSLAGRVASFDKNTIAAAIVVLVIIISVVTTVALTIFIVKKLHEKYRREFDAVTFEYGVLAKEWEAYTAECDELKIAQAECLQNQELIKQKIQKIEDLNAEIREGTDSGEMQEELASMVKEQKQDLPVLEKLIKDITELSNAVSTWNDSLNEKYKRLNAWQTELDKKFDKIKGKNRNT